MKLVFLYIYVLLTLLVSKGSTIESFQQKLRTDLFKNYDKESLPQIQAEKTTVITMDFILLEFSMNELEQSLDMNLWLLMNWTDTRLQWASQKYNNIESMTVVNDRVWLPDIVLFNNAKTPSYATFDKSGVVLFNTGNIIWVPPAKVSALCHVDMTFWPYDTHACKAKFGSWTRSAAAIDLKINPNKIKHMQTPREKSRKMGTYLPKWNLISIKFERDENFYPPFPEPYVDVTLSLTILRNGSNEVWTIVAPGLALCVLIIFKFMLHPNSRKKLALGGIGLILNVLFIQYAAYVTQSVSANTPLVVKFFCWQFFLLLASFVASVLSQRVDKKGVFNREMPTYMKPVLKCLAGATFVKVDNEELQITSDKENLFSTHESKKSFKNWMAMAKIFNRILFFVYVIVFITYLVTFFLYFKTSACFK